MEAVETLVSWVLFEPGLERGSSNDAIQMKLTFWVPLPQPYHFDFFEV